MTAIDSAAWRQALRDEAQALIPPLTQNQANLISRVAVNDHREHELFLFNRWASASFPAEISLLCRALCNNSTVKSLHFREDVTATAAPPGNGPVFDALSALLDAQRPEHRPASLDELDFQQCNMTAADIARLAPGLSSRRCSLKKLRFMSCELDTAAGVALFEALRDNRSVTHLSVESNAIGDRALHTLAAILEINLTLEQINWSHNYPPERWDAAEDRRTKDTLSAAVAQRGEFPIVVSFNNWAFGPGTNYREW